MTEDPRDGYEPVWEYLEDLLDYFIDIELEVERIEDS